MRDTLVIGAGVVGLAIAAELARRGDAVIVAEAAGHIGTGVSSRNSEVIHAGMYYPAQSLKARHCIVGRRRLYDWCAARGVPHRRTGKLIVATNEAERAKIEAIHAQGNANGVEGLVLIDGDAARAMEPALACVAALWSPETGIVDSHALMLSLQGAIEDQGGAVAFHTPVERIARNNGAWQVAFGGAEPSEIAFDLVVNAAGLGAQAVAAATEGFPADRLPRRVLAKGHYFACAGRPAFTRLIYPAPVDGGLGIHLTLDMGGRMKFGPDVEWVETEDYTVDPTRAAAFAARIRSYWPGLPQGALVPDYAGIRPKISGPGEPAADFRVDGPAEHGLPGMVHLFGIESPGLTASLSLGEAVADALG